MNESRLILPFLYQNKQEAHRQWVYDYILKKFYTMDTFNLKELIFLNTHNAACLHQNEIISDRILFSFCEKKI